MDSKLKEKPAKSGTLTFKSRARKEIQRMWSLDNLLDCMIKRYERTNIKNISLKMYINIGKIDCKRENYNTLGTKKDTGKFIKSRKKLGVRPKMRIRTNKGKRIWNSRYTKSLDLKVKLCKSELPPIGPKRIRFSNHKEYKRDKIIEEEANKVAKGEVFHKPTKIKNSATKEAVKGNEKLANVKPKNNTENKGNKWANPE